MPEKNTLSEIIHLFRYVARNCVRFRQNPLQDIYLARREEVPISHPNANVFLKSWMRRRFILVFASEDKGIFREIDSYHQNIFFKNVFVQDSLIFFYFSEA